uniref:Uncharacterized protein n=1 Tax=Siphoviridae sp. ctP6113 TaxID=2826318 RepID=A0A8S5MUF1_9CAUD|nr:MAG TPA: hypothetical protein [Siphoviridae sp. ctP6113]
MAKVHLEIIDEAGEATVRVEGKTADVLIAWVQLTASVAEFLNIQFPALLEVGKKSGWRTGEFNKTVETCRTEFSCPPRKD